ncbi:unnamed protein product [Medioppia subpectinata]|uniref:Cysteine dioxygenase n=1 Tax=Medioppia subpectinata TaxID=1979941 RepID=A0A7R9Q1U0_9ACAR|nr:unnamed protein product [Medioppia subpectinata]CAG2108734.1 unnamed protein product [Medioppia subpectinata]
MYQMLTGSLHEIRFEWPEKQLSTDGLNNNMEDRTGGMKVLDENVMKTNAVAYINDEMGLHRVENRSHTYRAVSLHLYIPPYSMCQTFDERTGHRNEAKVTFYSKYGSRTPFKSSKEISK